MTEESARAIWFWIRYIAILLTIAIALFMFDVIRGEMVRQQYQAMLTKSLERLNIEPKQPEPKAENLGR